MDSSETVVALVAAARAGDAQAWNDLVDRYLPLVRGVIGRVRLSPADAADVNQTVWLRLVEHLADLRDVRALPGWLATTAHREALRAAQSGRRIVPVDPQSTGVEPVATDDDLDEVVLAEERAMAVRDGLAELPHQRRQLLELLFAEPPLSYEEISSQLGIPIGSIGPTRARALQQLRNTRAMRAWAEPAPAGEEGGHHVALQ